MRHPKLDLRNPTPQRLRADTRIRLRMRSLVINPHTRRRARLGKPINTHPSQDLIITPLIPIRPIMEFFVDPSEEGGRGVRECEADCLRFCALEEVVAVAFVCEPGGAFDAGAFTRGVGG